VQVEAEEEVYPLVLVDLEVLEEVLAVMVLVQLQYLVDLVTHQAHHLAKEIMVEVPFHKICMDHLVVEVGLQL
jgi:hypothetical protein